jgi:hypothetical protein
MDDLDLVWSTHVHAGASGFGTPTSRLCASSPSETPPVMMTPGCAATLMRFWRLPAILATAVPRLFIACGPTRGSSKFDETYQSVEQGHRLAFGYGLIPKRNIAGGARLVKVKPLVSAMRDDAFEQPYLCTDATSVLVQQK